MLITKETTRVPAGKSMNITVNKKRLVGTVLVLVVLAVVAGYKWGESEGSFWTALDWQKSSFKGTEAKAQATKDAWIKELKLVDNSLSVCDLDKDVIVTAFRMGFVVTSWCRGPFEGQEERQVYLLPQFRLTSREVSVCLSAFDVDEATARRMQRQAGDFWSRCDGVLETCLRAEGLERTTWEIQAEPRKGFWDQCEAKVPKISTAG